MFRTKGLDESGRSLVENFNLQHPLEIAIRVAFEDPQKQVSHLEQGWQHQWQQERQQEWQKQWQQQQQQQLWDHLQLQHQQPESHQSLQVTLQALRDHW